MPNVGNAAFGLTSTGAAPFAPGVLLVGVGGLPRSLTAKGFQLWVDPVPLLLQIPVVANELGALQLAAPLPATPGLVGQTAYVQWVWTDACAPGPYAATAALAITFQP
jgi:hypothetical protein